MLLKKKNFTYLVKSLQWESMNRNGSAGLPNFRKKLYTKLSSVHRCWVQLFSVCCAHGMPWQVMTKQHCLLQCFLFEPLWSSRYKILSKVWQKSLVRFLKMGRKKICSKIHSRKMVMRRHECITQHLSIKDLYRVLKMLTL